MCLSLAGAGHDVSLIVADGLGDAFVDGVHVLDTGKPSSRIARMFSSAARVAQRANSLGADIVHLHDPELIRFAPLLKRSGAKVVLDAHEDVEKQILSKGYLPERSRILVSLAYGMFERLMLKHVDLAIGATPSITEKFFKLGVEAITVNNFPILGELETPDVVWAKKEPIVCYVGGMTAIRGARSLAGAAALLEVPRSISIAGAIAPPALQHAMAAAAGAGMTFLGALDRSEVAALMARSCAGVVTFLAAPNHIDSQPNKMFEYMSAGLPVIASNFPLWRDIIEGAQCGLLVDPLDSQAIAEAIDSLISDPVRAEALGRNGQRAVRERYNWDSEYTVLEKAYSGLLAC